MVKEPVVYILASKPNGTLYVGVSSDLIQRAWQHRNEVAKGFTQKYHVHRLVYVEQCADMEQAIAREKQIKKWRRAWKIALIEHKNPNWRDLWSEIN